MLTAYKDACETSNLFYMCAEVTSSLRLLRPSCGVVKNRLLPLTYYSDSKSSVIALLEWIRINHGEHYCRFFL